MTNPTYVENLRPVFNTILKRNQLSPQDIKTDQKYQFSMPDHGQFSCDQCVHNWQSRYSWVRFDLKELEICYRFSMKCKFCLLMCIPKFNIKQLENMFDKAVKRYKGEPMPRRGYKGRRRTFGEPHLPPLCEKCRWGARLCWIKRTY